MKYISKHSLRPVVFALLICSKYNKGYCIIPHAAQIILRGNNAFKVVFQTAKCFKTDFPALLHCLRFGFRTEEQNGGRGRKRKMAVKMGRKIQITTRKRKRVRTRRRRTGKNENWAAIWWLKKKKSPWNTKDKIQEMERNRRTAIVRKIREIRWRKNSLHSVDVLRDARVMRTTTKSTVISIILRR